MHKITGFLLVSLFVTSEVYSDNHAQLQGAIETLLKKVETLEKKIEQLENPESLKAPPQANLQHGPRVQKGREKIRVKFGGQVHRVVVHANDGKLSRTLHADNDSSSTLARVVAEGDMTNTTKAGAIIETGLVAHSTANMDIATGASGNDFNLRKAEAYFKNKTYGSLHIGQGEMASDGTMEDQDMSMTDIFVLGASADLAGGLKFRNKTSGAQGSQISDVLTSMDGLGRKNRIRYDSPRFYGFSVSGSHADKDSFDTALRWSYDKGVKIKAAGHGAKLRGKWDQFGYSMGILFPQGVNLHFGVAKRRMKDAERKKTPYIVHTKIGYRKSWFDIGETALALDFSQAGHIDRDGDRSQAYGASLVQEIASLDSEVYIGPRWYALHRRSEKLKKIFIMVMGLRLKF